MATEIQPIILTFSGGVNSRKRVLDVNLAECAFGENFSLDQQVASLQKRAAFDLSATAPNSGSINGYAQLIKRDGSVTTLIQAGGNVYTWDHVSAFTLVGTVASTAKLRGPREHNFTLDEYVIITDLEKAEIVKKWDGTTFGDFVHNLSGTFYAKYCRIHHERAIFANVKNSSTDLPHVMVGSKRGDADVLTVTDRPAGTLALDDPFFLISPDLKAINGLEDAFGSFIFSTRRGQLFQLTGSNAFDYEIKDFYAGSAVNGDEAIVQIGNDIALGLPARIESLSGTINYGDVETDDLTLPISDLIEKVTSWTLAYDRKKRRLYCFPDNQTTIYVLFKPILDAGELSPWARWTTGHQINFTPTAVMPMIHPTTKEDLIYFGDSTGNIFQFDGTGARDGGTTSIAVSRTSGLIRGLPEGNVMDIEGWITYSKQFAAVVTLTFQFAGEGLFDKVLTINLPAGEDIPVYSAAHGVDTAYYNGDFYYGKSFADRLNRQKFGPPGLNAWFQVKISIESEGPVDLHEVGFSFRAAKA